MLGERYEAGVRRLNHILGNNADRIIEKFSAVSPDFAKYIVEFAYGDLYTRQGISDKTRELVGVSSLVGQGNTGLPLKSHIHGMLNVGWTQNEIIEVIIFLVGYVGFPLAVEAMLTAQEVFNSKKAP